VPKDYKKAKMWFNTAFLKGIPTAAYMLGECAYYGHDEDVDYEKAAKPICRLRQNSSMRLFALAICI
jgi:TPR repeat protein